MRISDWSSDVCSSDLLCGFGGGNFASSLQNISFFFPKARKGNAMALNAGLGNLGVSEIQIAVPLNIKAGVFGALGGAPQQTAAGGTLRQQTAGFVWGTVNIPSSRQVVGRRTRIDKDGEKDGV